MKNVLILGASGFSGSHLYHYLSSKPEEYSCMPVASKASRNSRDSGIALVDLASFDEIMECIRSSNADYIISLVGKYGNSSFEDLFQANVFVAQQVMSSVLELGKLTTRILFIGSAAEYGLPNEIPISENHSLSPVNLYGLTKMYQSKLVDYYYRMYGVSAMIGRTFNLRGKGLPPCLAIGNFQRQIDEAIDGSVIKVGNLETERDYLDVNKAVRDYEKILINGVPGEAYNVCSGVPLKIRSLLDQLISESKKRINVEVDSSLLRQNDTPIVIGSRKKIDAL